MEEARKTAIAAEVRRRMALARATTGLSQNALARRIDVSSTQVLRWERGDYLPGVLDLIAYAEECGTTAEQMLGDLSRHPTARQMSFSWPDLDPPARGVILRLVDLLRERSPGTKRDLRRPRSTKAG